MRRSPVAISGCTRAALSGRAMSPLTALLAFAAAAHAAAATGHAAPGHDITGNDIAVTGAGADTVVPPHGCVEAGEVYAEGSPLASDTECERCFCLGGRRRCVRPRCLAPPAGCGAAPASGACCPQRYHCHHNSTTTPTAYTDLFNNSGECIVEGKRVPEGEPVRGEACAHCYCLRGAVRCQSAACARALLDCRPLLKPGQCCPHRYRCPARSRTPTPTPANRSRAMHALDPTTAPITTKLTLTEASDEPVHPTSPQNDVGAMNRDSNESAFDRSDATARPEGSVRIVINGTINCTAELAGAPAPDIITEATTYLDGDSFVVNVTSSLRTNSSRPSDARPPVPTSTSSARTEYDYDYNEPTLPPSLPNLKIIPFVAADAVVQLEERPSPPPPAADLRRPEPPSVYAPPPPPPPAHRRRDDAPPPPPLTPRHTTASPVIGLFSPPAHIEGGFVPKDASFDGDETAQPTPSASPTTLSTQNSMVSTVTGSGACTTADGETIQSGASVVVMCEECACARGRLSCTRRPCRTPPACRRLAPPRPTLALVGLSLNTYCCGELICEHGNNDTTTESSVEKETGKPSQLPQQTIEPEPVTPEIVPYTTLSTTSRTTTVSTSTVATSTRGTGPERDATTIQPRPTTSDRTPPDYTEEDDDEGFSFGNMLQLLLSDGYGTTSATTATRAPPTPRTPPVTAPPALTVTSRTTLADPPTPISNRIDHLLLGQATSIRRTTPRPTTVRAPSPPAPEAPAGGGLLSKLAGCNIYGRMYRVGRIIAELSSACAECRCTELGVQCHALHC